MIGADIKIEYAPLTNLIGVLLKKYRGKITNEVKANLPGITSLTN
jgi:hypothetical protein